MIKYFILIVVMLAAFAQPMSAQRFKAAAIVGANASQIDGDNLYGFNKLGVSAGGRLSYVNNKSLDFAMEMLISQRVSRESIQ
ncbi:MAG: hypothetical protein IPP49_02535 [Saprospiraceae bacterium]|nr:hypothetical protein [Saprospiraceae bacterium]